MLLSLELGTVFCVVAYSEETLAVLIILRCTSSFYSQPINRLMAEIKFPRRSQDTELFW